MQTLCECDLSIIIPVYNLERFLWPMLTSLRWQHLGPYKAEIIFVLNNCTDLSEAVIRDAGISCTIITCREQGCGPARNAGLEIAKGRYVWFMDGDDWLLSDTAVLKVLSRALLEDLDVLRIPFESNLFRRPYFSMVWQYCLKREFIEGIRFPSYQPGEDDAFMEEVLAKMGLDRRTYLEGLPHMDRPLYFYYYMREGSNMFRHCAGEKI